MVDFSYKENISIDFQTPRGYIISTNVHLKAHNRQTIGFLDAYLNKDVFMNTISSNQTKYRGYFFFLQYIYHIVGWYNAFM